MSETQGDTPLSELCTICHINPPKYRCPRCFTRTCSLPCTKRHKTWSQCSGVRDPAAYVRRSELATPAAFDRDFNFITSIERSLERAERDAENRGIPIDHDYGDDAGAGAGKKRKRPQEQLVKGEAAFLRGAERSGVRVMRAPRGMTRNKQNTSRWHPKHKCLSWTIEWIAPDGQKTLRNCLETCTVAEAYDRVYPPPKEEREKEKQSRGDQQQDVQGDKTDHVPVNGGDQPETTDSTTPPTAPAEDKQDQPPAESQVHKEAELEEKQPGAQETTAPSSRTVTPEPPPPQEGEEKAQTQPQQPEPQPETQQSQPEPGPETSNGDTTTTTTSPETPTTTTTTPHPHRGLYFYLHRPRTTTKQPVLIPLLPTATVASALRDRLVLEFPTVYVLPYSPEELLSTSSESEAGSKFMLEEEYLRTQAPEEEAEEGQKSDEDEEDDDDENEDEDDAGNELAQAAAGIDETKVLEVLKQDLMGAPAPAAAAAAEQG